MNRSTSVPAPVSATLQMQTPFSLFKLCFLFLSVIFLGCQFRQPLRITILFYNAPKLEEGDPIFYQSARVGEVLSVGSPMADLPRYKVVEAAIDRDFSHLLHRQMAFTVDSFRLLNQQRRIVIMDRVAAPKIPIKNGDVFVGTTYLRYLLGQTTDITVEIIDVLKTLSARTVSMQNQPSTNGMIEQQEETQTITELFRRYVDQLTEISRQDTTSSSGIFVDSVRAYIH